MKKDTGIKPTEFLAGNSDMGSFKLDLAVTPNLLVGGTSGTGKSVFLQQIITSLMTHNDPSKVRFGLIDSKLGVEFTKYNKNPFLLNDAVTDKDKASTFIKYIKNLMLSRYQNLRETKTISIEEYNQLKEKMSWPYIILVIDDFGDLITKLGDRTVSRPDIQNRIIEISQKGNLVGIHVILAAQKPNREVLSSKLRSNFTGRVAFRTINETDGYLFLGKGAFPEQFSTEKLNSPGECLISSNGNIPYKCQVPNITNPQIVKVVKDGQKKYTDSSKFFPVDFNKFTSPNGSGEIINDVYTY